MLFLVIQWETAGLQPQHYNCNIVTEKLRWKRNCGQFFFNVCNEILSLPQVVFSSKQCVHFHHTITKICVVCAKRYRFYITKFSPLLALHSCWSPHNACHLGPIKIVSNVFPYQPFWQEFWFPWQVLGNSMSNEQCWKVLKCFLLTYCWV